jgi:hypothetical protein
MPSKSKSVGKDDPLTSDVLSTPELEVPRFFGAGAVAKILKIDDWRVQKFLTSTQYGLSSSEKSATVQGARRVFTDLDVLRIGVAAHLTRDGFTPTLVAQVIDTIANNELLGVDNRGRDAHFGLALSRGEKSPAVDVFLWDERQEFVKQNQPYYQLDLGEFCKTVRRSMKEVNDSKRKNK